MSGISKLAEAFDKNREKIEKACAEFIFRNGYSLVQLMNAIECLEIRLTILVSDTKHGWSLVDEIMNHIKRETCVIDLIDSLP